MAKSKRPKGKFYHRAIFKQDDAVAFILPVLTVARAVLPKSGIARMSITPLCVPNEFICAKLGTFLGLPIPPFSITYFNDEPYFTVLNFNPRAEDLPAIDPVICAKKFPELCTGIMFFDILVANEDRHDKNLAVDNVAKPNQLIVYDHDQALFGGGGNLSGTVRLNTLRDRLGITGSSLTGGNECCLLRAIDTVEYFEKWRYRISEMPNWFISDTCIFAMELGIDKSQATAAEEFLIYRKKNLGKILKSCGRDIPLIDNWELQNDLFSA